MRKACFGRAIAVTLVLSCLSAGGGKADYVSGNQLWDYCKDANSVGFCYGYIIGVAETADILEFKQQSLFCIRPEVKKQQLADVVTQYLGEHPEHRDWPGQNLVILALREKFPCEAQ